MEKNGKASGGDRSTYRDGYDSLCGYCQAYARWKEAEEFITQHGTMIRTPNGYLQQVPQVSIAQTNLKIMLKFF